VSFSFPPQPHGVAKVTPITHHANLYRPSQESFWVSILRCWLVSIVHPTASVEARFFTLPPPSELGGQEGASCASSGQETAGKCFISSDFLSTSSPSFHRSVCPPVPPRLGLVSAASYSPNLPALFSRNKLPSRM